MSGQLGYRSKFFRGATQVPFARVINPPEPSRDRVDTTHLESAAFTKENVAGFIDLPEVTVECIHVNGNAVQDQLEVDFYAGLQTPETWSHQICNPDTGATERTYTYSGYISSCLRGPLSAQEAIIMTLKIQVTSSIVIS